MNQRKAFLRKLVYLGIIVVLLVPIALLSQPASAPPQEPGQPVTTGSTGGGLLASMRDQAGLSNAALGDVDPTSEAIKLASLGFRGVAANILWTKANEYKKKEDWSHMMATVDTIFRLQPHFISVWQFQAWNVSYNVSVEWDDYRDRYYWVMRGVKCLQDGTTVNNEDPTLLWETGWFISHKIGKSDETDQFRRLFREDNDFHGPTPVGERDNWPVGKTYYRRAEQVVDNDAVRRVKGRSKLIVHATPGLNNFYHAIAQGKENPGMSVRDIWQLGEREWTGLQPILGSLPSLGERSIKLSLHDEYIKLNDFEAQSAKQAQVWEEINTLEPGLYEKLVAQRLDSLTPTQRLAFETGEEQRSMQQWEIYYEVKDQLEVDARTLAEAMPTDKRDAALALADDWERAKFMAHWIDRYREIVNFNYWRTRTQAEQTDDAYQAQLAQVEARQAFQVDANLRKGREEYSRSLEHWRLVLEAFPNLREDSLTGEDLIQLTSEFRDLTSVLGGDFPPAGYGLVSVNEVKDWQDLVSRLVTAAQASEGESSGPPAEKLASQVWPRLSGPVQQSLQTAAKANTGQPRPLALDEQTNLLFEVHRALLAEDFDWTQVFGGDATGETARLLGLDAGQLTGHEQRLRMRQLLEAAWPDLIEPAAQDRYVLYRLVETHPDLIDEEQLDFNALVGRLTPVQPGQTEANLPPAGEKTDDLPPAGTPMTAAEPGQPDQNGPMTELPPMPAEPGASSR